MSELEEHILESAKPRMEELQKQIDTNEIDIQHFNRTRILFPFECDGVCDFICYNADMKNFEYIEYRYGKGVGVRFEGDDTVTYNLEDTEMRKIIL